MSDKLQTTFCVKCGHTAAQHDISAGKHPCLEDCFCQYFKVPREND